MRMHAPKPTLHSAQDLVKDFFVFWQRTDRHPEGQTFCELYKVRHLREAVASWLEASASCSEALARVASQVDALPLICAVDGVTGRLLKKWSFKQMAEPVAVQSECKKSKAGDTPVVQGLVWVRHLAISSVFLTRHASCLLGVRVAVFEFLEKQQERESEMAAKRSAARADAETASSNSPKVGEALPPSATASTQENAASLSSHPSPTPQTPDADSAKLHEPPNPTDEYFSIKNQLSELHRLREERRRRQQPG